MRCAFHYKLRLNTKQILIIDEWLRLLKCQYNYRLAERFNWYERNRTDVNSCPLICHLPELKEKPDFYSQKRDIVNTKSKFPEYKNIHSQVLQDCIKRVDLAFKRFLKGDCNGKRSGKPRFKSINRYRSFTYPQIKQDYFQGNKINLPKIGKIKVIKHRNLPRGFAIKTVTIIKKADGYYVTLSVEDKSIPTFKPDIKPTLDNTIGIDMGLKDFLICSDGETVNIQQHYRHQQQELKKVQKTLSRKKKGSKNRSKAIKKLGKKHQKIANQRRDFHYKTAQYLINKADVIAHEKLNVLGLARTKLAKSIYDAGWSQFLEVLKYKAEKAGILTVEVNPKNTTQDCSVCGIKVPKTLNDRVHVCNNCGTILDRDINAARNIKYRAVGHSVLKAYRVTEALAGVGRKPTLTH